ncbi:MAG: hypothetical protein HC804_12695 [Anaerolineae bacterium]|nr:hypothetical protein [Anaerolineae bacterium]
MGCVVSRLAFALVGRLEPVLGGVGLVTAVMVILGVMGRVMALPLLFPLGFTLLVQEGTSGGDVVATEVALLCTVLILLLGTGAFSLWRPEERFMVRRAGERVKG